MKKTLCTILSVIILATSTVTSVYAGNTDIAFLKATTVKSFNRTSVKSGKLVIKSVKGASKYEVQYSNNKKFKNSKVLDKRNKIITKTTTINISNNLIKHSKNVYVRVRYNKNNKWSNWSKYYSLNSSKKFYSKKLFKSATSTRTPYVVYWVNSRKEEYLDFDTAMDRVDEITIANSNGDYSASPNNGQIVRYETITIPAHYEYTWYKR